MNTTTSAQVSKPKNKSKIFRIIAFILVFGAIGGALLYFAKAETLPQPPTSIGAGYSYKWGDEFNGASLDTSKWGAFNKSNYGDNADSTTDACLWAKNVTEGNGNLVINSKKETTTCNGTNTDGSGSTYYWTSGFVTTSARADGTQRYDFKHGYAEVRAKSPVFNAAWPSFWLVGGTGAPAWPGYGEFDVMELSTIKPDKVGWGIHFTNAADGQHKQVTPNVMNAATWSADSKGALNGSNLGASLTPDNIRTGFINSWHTYGILWTADLIRYYIDGRPSIELRRADMCTYNSTTGVKYTNYPCLTSKYNFFDIAHTIHLGTNVGGRGPINNGYTGHGTPTGYVDGNLVMQGPANWEIDYVRVFQQGDTTPPQQTVDTTAPTANITAPAANASVQGLVNVTATASDNVEVTKTQFYVDGTLQVAGDDTTEPYAFSWNTTTLSNGSHTIGVEAVDAAGNRSARKTVTVTVNNPDTAPPVVTLTAPADGSTVKDTVSVTATATDNLGVTKVQFLVDGAIVTGADDTTSPYAFSWDTTKLLNGSHTISAQAVDAAGNKSLKDTSTVTVANADTTKPAAATNVKATADAYNKTTVTWTAATDNVGVTAYLLVRNGTTIAILGPVTTYTDNDVQANTKYDYYLIAGDKAGNTSDNSATASVTTPNPPDTTAPSVPTGLTATAVSTNQVNLSWKASTDNVGVTGYEVYRGTTKVATVTSTTYGDGSLNQNTKYDYTIKAKDGAGNVSNASATASATTQTAITTGNLTGKAVRSSNGAAIANLPVTIAYNGAFHTVKTNSKGYYAISGIPAGNYTIQYAKGYTYASQYINVDILAGVTKTVDVTMVRI